MRNALFAAAALVALSSPPCSLRDSVHTFGKQFSAAHDSVTASGRWVAEPGTPPFSPALNAVTIECTPAQCEYYSAGLFSEGDPVGSGFRGYLSPAHHRYRVTRWSPPQLVVAEDRQTTITIRPRNESAERVVTGKYGGRYSLQ